MTPTSRRVHRRATRLVVGSAAIAALATVSACGSDPDQHSAGNYCTQVGDHLTQLDQPQLATQADIDSMLGTWKAVAGTAPLAIQREWDSLVNSMETVSTVDPNDPESVKLALDTAREAEAEANVIIDYTYRTCNALIGDVAPATQPPPSTTASTDGAGTAVTTSTSVPPSAADPASSTPATGA